MTQPGWLLDQTGDGRLTILVDRRAAYLYQDDLIDLMRRRLTGAHVLSDGYAPVGFATLSDDGSRIWLDIGPQRLFVWVDSLRDVVYGDRASAPLEIVHGMNTAPARSAGPLHA